MMRLVRSFLSAALLVGCSSLLHAQGVDPGENLLKEEQRKRQLEQLTQGTGGQEIQTPELQGPIAEAVCFPIKEIELAGVSVLELAAFDQILNEYSGRCLGQVSIGYLLQRITIVYADLGYITTRAYVPAQDIGTQKLVVEVLEGRIEAFVYQQLDAQGQPKAGETRKITTAFPIKAGDVFQLRDIEHGLEQMNRLKSSQANANLAAGQAPGTSQVVITEVKSDWFRGSFGLDNRGSPDTGETQVRFSLEADDVAEYGTAGPNGGFVMPKYEFDDLMAQSGGNLSIVEQQLGLPAGSLSNGNIVALEISPTDYKNLSLPSGNEPGVNSNWVPGGYTSGGVAEAVMDFDGVPFTPIVF